MNDKEYYALTNRNSSWQLRRKLEKLRERKKLSAKKTNRDSALSDAKTLQTIVEKKSD